VFCSGESLLPDGSNQYNLVVPEKGGVPFCSIYAHPKQHQETKSRNSLKKKTIATEKDDMTTETFFMVLMSLMRDRYVKEAIFTTPMQSFLGGIEQEMKRDHPRM
jgi:hypothetical protein